MTIRSRRGATPTLGAIRAQFKLDADDLDERFGLVLVGSDDHTYALRVHAAAARKLQSDTDWIVDGPFPDPPLPTPEKR